MVKNLSMQQMLELLGDPSVDLGGRDDIVLILAEEGDESALSLLHEIASKPRAEDDIELIGACGEAIAKIMCRSGRFQYKYINGLIPYKWGSALHNAINIIKELRPDWYFEHNLDNLEKTKLVDIVKISK